MTMQALVLKNYNEPLQLLSLPKPVPGHGEVRVRIAASGLNPLDTKIRAGAAAHAKHPLPLVPGIDMAGVIDALGAGVHAFRVGDEVYGMTGGVGGIQGSLAQYAVVDVRLLAHKPVNIGMREAAALPLAFITAWSGMVDRAHLQAGQTLLVQGGGGGVGHVAVQLGRALGAKVFATAGVRDHERLRQYGATPIDYRQPCVAEIVKSLTDGAGVDLVVDTVGGATLDASFLALKHYGHVVSALGWGTHALAPLSFREATYSGVFTLHALLSGQHRARHGAMLREASRLVEAGLLKPCLSTGRFTLDTAESAFASLTNGTAHGKVVVDIL